jgi:type II secretory pathway component GspD/PulD (secretin)
MMTVVSRFRTDRVCGCTGKQLQQSLVVRLVSYVGLASYILYIENNTNFAIYDAPEGAKAVVMASATHDVEAGAFNRRGAGCIDADKAVDLVENDQYIEDIFYETNSAQDYFIDLNAGETLQLAVCWQSNSRMADWSSPDNARADINLNLYFYDPSGNILRG